MTAPNRSSHDTPPFLKALLTMLRAQSHYGSLDGKSPEYLLSGYVHDPKESSLSPLGECTPTQASLPRLECFFAAAAREVERRSGLPATALVSITGEGFGRAVILSGRLVCVLRHVRSANSFGFPSLDALVQAGEQVISEALDMAGRFPEAARHR